MLGEVGMNLTFADIDYHYEEHACFKWFGVNLHNGTEFIHFIQNEVHNRLNDVSGREEFRSHLRSLALTGMGKDNLEEVLNAEISEEREWAVGEALAEALLISKYGMIFPWNVERDKRSPNSSLPGADIIGFLPEGTGFRLALGEVKTSREERYPPQVMSGRSGLNHQIENLAVNMNIIYQLLSWLLRRIKNTQYETAYNQSVTLYLNSGKKAATLFGVLIRDTASNELDLKNRAKALSLVLKHPASCELMAVYLPCKIDELLTQMKGAS